MISIYVPGGERYSNDREFFVYVESEILELEHSLESISKWESKWCKSFLSTAEKTNEEILDYIRCMTLNDVDDNIYYFLTDENVEDISKYIAEPMTATVINRRNQKPSREVITAELIYYWMIALGIPWECQKWHLNRLLTLIEVCNIKNTPPKKMSKKEVMAQNRALNEQRRRQYNTKG